MSASNSFQKVTRDTQLKQIGGLDPLKVLLLVIKNWYFFIITVALAVLAGRIYITHTLPVFRSTTLILIKEIGERNNVANEELLQGLGLPGGMRNMDNQIRILTSKDLTEKTLKELSFDIEFYHKTFKNNIPVYPEVPVRIIYNKEIPLPRGIEFSLSFSGDNKFILNSERDYFQFHKSAEFGENIILPGGASFQIDKGDQNWLKENKNQKLYFIIYSKVGLINYFNNRLSVELLSRGGSILSVSITGTNRTKDVDFLNKLAEVFQSISLDKKNAEAVRRIQFIDGQLIGISDSLSTTENKLQQFRSTNRIMDLSAQGQAIITQVNALENEKARLSLEANYYDYLADYLAKDIPKEVPIVPITMGITDPGLTGLVNNLADLQGQLMNRGAGEKNPLQDLLLQRVRSTRAALLETLNGLRRANSLARSENQDQINKVNAQASALPVTERQLLGIERKFRLNDQLYNFLLETRSNQQMQKASNTADSEVVDPANPNYSTIIAPSAIKVYFISLFAGFGIPLVLLLLSSVFNKKLKEEDLKDIADLPIMGYIPHSAERSNLVVFNFPNSAIAESYRLMRSRMQFLTKEATKPVVLVSSSIPEEGKTFTAINLAAVYSLLGKKTVLVGFDLRKPKIHEEFELDNEKGISTWLIGQDKFDDIIKQTSFPDLFLITAGPVPPNPSELIALEKTGELIKKLKEKFDFIIVDTSPIGFVSDTFHLVSFADAFLLVVRPGKTLKEELGRTINEITASSINGISMVVNDIQSDKKYSIGEKYGYMKEKNSSKWNIFRRKKSGRKKS